MLAVFVGALIACRSPAAGAVRRTAGAGEPVEQHHIALRRGQYLSAVARQQGMDVELVLYDPAGRAALDVDSQNSETGSEHLDFIAEQSGLHRLVVQRRSAALGGRYTLDVGVPHAPTPDEVRRAEACRLQSDARRLVRSARSTAERRLGMELFRRAARLWREVGDVMAEALTETDLGKAWWELDDVDRALAAWERARGLLDRQGLADALPTLLNRLGTGYDRRGERRRARQAWGKALSSARHVGDRGEEIAALNQLAFDEHRAGAPWAALARLDEAIALAEETEEWEGLAAALTHQGRVLTVLGKLDDAQEALTRAVELWRAAGRPDTQALATVELGWAHFLAGDPRRARQELDDAVALARAAGDRRAAALALARLGALARDTGAPAEAVADDRQALAVYRAGHDAPEVAIGLSNLGLAQFLAGDPAAGLGSTAAAVARLEALGDVSAAAYARCRRARCERALHRLAAARADVEAGLTKLDALRAQAASNDLRMSYLDSVHDQYELLVDILMDMHAAQPRAGFDRAALAAVERGRARGLLDLIAVARQSGVPRDSPALRRLRAVDARIRAMEIAASPPGNLHPLLAERQAALVALRPAAAAAATARVLRTDEIQRQVLDPGTVLVVYALGDRRGFVWALTRDRLWTAVLPPRAAIEDSALRLHQLLTESRAAEARARAGDEARKLSGILLGPVAAALGGGRRVAVLPDGGLAYVPFSVLPEPGAAGGLVLDHHEVVVLPSASVLAAIRRRTARRPRAPKLLAVLADPATAPTTGGPATGAPATAAPATAAPAAAAAAGGVPPGAVPPGATSSGADAVTRSLAALGLQQIAPLPDARREAEAILALVPRDEQLGAMGPDANRTLVLGGKLQAYRILHFATHALVHPSVPELSGILLATADAHGRPEAGFLQSFEIADQNLPADLVVLSACSTGLGRELKGEGLVGLTQSFFDAGAARVVVSLWEVSDRATAAVMKAFYRELLRGGRSPAAALRAAQLAVRQDPRYQAPFYWAAFELQGDWQPLR